MNSRQLNVVHLLVTHNVRGSQRFLFHPHDKWASPSSGEPFLALPTKKILGGSIAPVDAGMLRGTLAGVLREDLGVEVEHPTWKQRLAPVVVETYSPTRKEPTTYHIVPLVVRVNRRQYEPLRTRLGGSWLTGEEALGHRALSPTARGVLERLCAPGTGGSGGQNPWTRTREEDPEDEAWTCRLVRGREGDGSTFGSLFKEMTPWLTEALHTCGSTCALFRVAQDVEDALNETAMKVWVGLEKFDPEGGSAKAWVWIIARNSAISILRKRTRNRTFSLWPRDGAMPWEQEDEGGDPALAAEEADSQEQALRRLEQLVAASSPLLQRAWQLRQIQHKRYADIAAELGMAPGTVGGWFFRLRNAIRGSDGTGGPSLSR